MSFHRPLVAVVAVVPIAFATSLVAQPKPQAPSSANQIAERVQKFYDKARVLLLDTQGNRNGFDFTLPVLNRKIAASEFAFRPPAGTQVVR